MKLANIMMMILVLVASIASPLGKDLEVGPYSTFVSIQSAVDAAEPGDTIFVESGVYNEVITIGSEQLTLSAKEDHSPVIVGRIQLYSSSDITIDGFEIRGWTGSYHGIDQSNGTGLTIRNCKIHSGGETSWTAGINSRNSTRLTIQDNEIFNVSKGLRLHSGHSTDSSFDNGVLIRNNLIHDCPVDGIDIHGEYFTIDSNTIANNINADWKQHHPDGIQFIKSVVDNFSVASNVVIKNNIIYNHTQNVFIEGDGIENVYLFNNIIFNESGFVNGADLGGMATKNLISSGVNGLYIYNNLFGHCTNISVLLQGFGAFYFQNNILIDGAPGAALDVEFPESLLAGAFSHNLFHISDGWAIVWGDQWFENIFDFESALPEFTDIAFEGDPLIGMWPEAVPEAGSPAIDAGLSLPLQYAIDRLGAERPSGKNWDIGPYEFQAETPQPPKNLRLQVNP